MQTHRAEAQWQGSLEQGMGTLRTSRGALTAPYSYGSRFGDAEGTSPEELIGAAHAGCYSMALTHALEDAGFSPEKVQAFAETTIEPVDDGFAITNIHLRAEAQVPEIENAQFDKIAETAKEQCPVSRALAGTPITLQASVKSVDRSTT